MHRERRCADEPIEARFDPDDLADVVEDELVEFVAGSPHETEVRQRVAFAAQTRAKPQGTAAPQQPFPGKRNVRHEPAYEGLGKVTFGTVFASGGAWKNGYSLNPNTFAVTLAGNCRRDVLYAWTFSL